MRGLAVVARRALAVGGLLATAVLVPTAVGPAPPAQAVPSGNDLVINEVVTDGGGFSDPPPFVELFNPTPDPIDLSSWTVASLTTPAGQPTPMTSVLRLSGVVPPYSTFLIEAASFSTQPFPQADLFTEDLLLSREGSTTIMLFHVVDNREDTVDIVGFGLSPYCWENGTANTGCERTGSFPTAQDRVLRRACGADTDNNAVDFIGGGTPTPLNSSGPAVSCAPPCLGMAPTVVGSGTITGTPGDDVILASNGDDVIDGAGGDDLVCSLAGHDQVSTHAGADRVLAGPGNDEITVGTGANYVSGGAGDDSISSGLSSSTPDAGGDTINGNGGNDSIAGLSAADVLRGGPGADDLTSNGGTDLLLGGEDDDTLVVNGLGLPQAHAGGGDDTLLDQGSHAGPGVLAGGAGADLLSAVTGGPNTMIGGPGADDLRGSNDDDDLFGGDGVDILAGNDGNDDLRGGADDDSLSGGNGDDALFGGPGVDSLDGGPGTNTLRQ